MMTVDDLIKQLKQYPGNLNIYLAIDPEGNGYNLVNTNCLADGYLKALDYYTDGMKFHTKLTPDLKNKGYTEEDLADKNDIRVLVIFPG